MSGLRINELAAKTQPGQIWIKRVVAEMGGKDAIVVDADCDLDKGRGRRAAVSAFGYQGQKCSACSRAIVDAKVYDEFLEKLQRAKATLRWRQADRRSGELHGPGDQRERAADNSGIYRDRQERRPAAGGRRRRSGRRIFRCADDHCGRGCEGADFPGRDFRPGAGGDQGRQFRARPGAGQRLAIWPDGRGLLERSGALRATPASSSFVGNLYLNRKCTGAMVGAHPFGGFNMSGTDSKAGGPDYLLLFLQAKSIAERVA